MFMLSLWYVNWSLKNNCPNLKKTYCVCSNLFWEYLIFLSNVLRQLNTALYNIYITLSWIWDSSLILVINFKTSSEFRSNHWGAALPSHEWPITGLIRLLFPLDHLQFYSMYFKYEIQDSKLQTASLS